MDRFEELILINKQCLDAINRQAEAIQKIEAKLIAVTGETINQKTAAQILGVCTQTLTDKKYDFLRSKNAKGQKKYITEKVISLKNGQINNR